MKIKYDTTANTIKTVINDMMKIITSKIGRGEKLVVALSGGSTPVPIYEGLAKQLDKLMINPSDFILLTQIDERFVESSSPRSNQKMIRDIFGDRVRFLMMPQADQYTSIEEGLIQFDSQLNQVLSGSKKIDLSILGMGTDGHTASLFPENEDYLKSRELDINVIAVEDVSVPEARISMTSRLINQSRDKFLILFGEDKAEVLSTALEANDPIRYPVLSVMDNITVYTDQQLS